MYDAWKDDAGDWLSLGFATLASVGKGVLTTF
jgi:hypothetical protein